MAMPSSKRKSIPGRCSLPREFVHVNPAQSLMMGGMGQAMGYPMFGMQQPMSLADLGKHHPLAITYGSGASARGSTTVAESVRSTLPKTDIHLFCETGN